MEINKHEIFFRVALGMQFPKNPINPFPGIYVQIIRDC
jgi:hypothetical protein